MNPVDARGLYCPLPVLRARDRLRNLRPGDRFDLLVDDPEALRDVPRFCEDAGHEFLGHEAEPGGGFRLKIRRGPGP